MVLLNNLVTSLPLAAQTYTASPIPAGSYGTYPYSTTGLLLTSKTQGSGAVVANPRVVFSCAHVVFDKAAIDPWMNGVRWHRAWSTGTAPFTGTGQSLRGYYHYVGYATAAMDKANSDRSFSQDFVVHYAYEDTAGGGFAGYFDDGVSQLKANTEKLVTGYPAGLYGSVDSRKYLMHQTGPFTRVFAANLNDYFTATDVSAGPGNSGGPVWVKYQGEYYFVGVMISGLERSLGDSTDLMGVYGVDSSSRELINNAVRASGATIAAPTITTQPTSRRVNSGSYVTFTVVASGSLISYQWLFNGGVITGATDSELTLTNVSPASAGTYQVLVSNTGGVTRSTVATLSVDSVPTITSQPTSRTVVAGDNATLSVSIESSTPATYQWRKDGVPISGATNATLTLSNVQGNAAGSYVVIVTNSVGSVSSSTAVLTLSPPLAITTQPRPQTLTVGSNLVLTVGASGGAGTITYQWRFNGTALLNGSSSTYSASNVGTGFSGTFDVVISDGVRTLTSAPARITVVSVSRISNLSILTSVTASDPVFTVGTVIGGAGTNGAKPLLIRAAGPSLAQLGVAGALPDPKLDVFSGQATVLSNNDWGGSTALSGAFAQVGAFNYISGTSKDAAVYSTSMPAGAYTVQVGGVGGTIGTVIAELYDATPESTFVDRTPRLVNVSVLKQIVAGETLTAGFVIAGSTAKAVLIRAIGPTLGAAPFNIPGAMSDPKLDLFRGQSVINSNNDWGGGATLSAAFSSVGAFALPASSKDAALHVTLTPGNYTAQVSGFGGANGLTLVEVYEIP